MSIRLFLLSRVNTRLASAVDMWARLAMVRRRILSFGLEINRASANNPERSRNRARTADSDRNFEFEIPFTLTSRPGATMWTIPVSSSAHEQPLVRSISRVRSDNWRIANRNRVFGFGPRRFWTNSCARSRLSTGKRSTPNSMGLDPSSWMSNDEDVWPDSTRSPARWRVRKSQSGAEDL